MKKLFYLTTCTVAVFLAGMGTVLAAGLGQNIAVRLVGTETAYESGDLFDMYGVEGLPSYCWDFDLQDVNTGDVIGAITDCAAIVGVVGGTFGVDAIENLGFQVVGTAFFHLPGGTVGTRILTTVQPVTHGSPDVTHISGAIPQPDENNVIYGDGRFAGAEGTARLVGSGNFSDFLATGETYFDCIYVLDLGPENP